MESAIILIRLIVLQITTLVFLDFIRILSERKEITFNRMVWTSASIIMLVSAFGGV